ncbi:MAG TPA: ABC transporter permease [Longimicrobiales bacterium]
MRSFLTLLVRLFPLGFRRQFAPDIIEQIESDYELAARRGTLAVLLFSLSTSFDLVRGALAERWNPTWATARDPDTTGREVAMTMNEWTKDLRLALRALRRAPGFTAVTVITLGLAIGANAGIFSIVDTVLLEPLPYPASDRLVHIAASAPGTEFPDEFGVAAEFYVHYGEQSELLESVSTYNSFTSTLRVGDRTERVRMSFPTPSLFSTLGATPILGRLPTPEDEDRVAVISHAAWTSWFASDPDVIGQSYYISGTNRTVIGVMAPGFWFPREDVLLWVPSDVRAEDITPGRFGAPLVGRVAPDVTNEALADELTRLALQLPERFGGSAAYARLMERHRPVVRSMEEELLGDVRGPLRVLLGSVGIVLLIACGNVANLFIVRAEHRQRDLAVRRALGAGRRALIRSQMAEAVLIAGLAGALAVGLARVSLPLFIRAAPDDVPRLGEVGLGATTLLFTLGASLFAALACGLLPAIRASAPNLDRLREAGRGSTGRRHWARNGLVVGQTALALVLLIGSGLLVRSFWSLRNVDPGYDTADLFTFQIAPERSDLTDGPAWAAFHMDFAERIRALPGVASVGIVENLPLNEGVSSGRYLTEATAADVDGGALVYHTWAGEDYFATMGIEVRQGRAFQRSDHISDLGNVIVSRSAADLMWPGESPVGQRLKSRDLDQWETVVGVVEDVLQYGFRDDPQPMIYFPLVGQTPTQWALSSPAYVVKTPRAESIGPEIREIVREIAPMAPMYRMFTMEGLAADSMVRLSFTMLTLGIASLMALILGAIGLFGVLSYVVAERTQEIGLRMALGAEARRVQGMVVGQGARVVLLGVALGIAAALASTRILGNLLFGVEAIDAGTFVGMSATMLLVGLLASYLPARRASNVDPIQSLRGE